MVLIGIENFCELYHTRQMDQRILWYFYNDCDFLATKPKVHRAPSAGGPATGGGVAGQVDVGFGDHNGWL